MEILTSPLMKTFFSTNMSFPQSSLNCVGDKTSWAYQLFNIYQQYPDKLLRAMMTKTRADRMVSLRKHYMRTHMRSGDYLPLSSSPYQLSIRWDKKEDDRIRSCIERRVFLPKLLKQVKIYKIIVKLFSFNLNSLFIYTF